MEKNIIEITNSTETNKTEAQKNMAEINNDLDQTKIIENISIRYVPDENEKKDKDKDILAVSCMVNKYKMTIAKSKKYFMQVPVLKELIINNTLNFKDEYSFESIDLFSNLLKSMYEGNELFIPFEYRTNFNICWDIYKMCLMYNIKFEPKNIFEGIVLDHYAYNKFVENRLDLPIIVNAYLNNKLGSQPDLNLITKITLPIWIAITKECNKQTLDVIWFRVLKYCSPIYIDNILKEITIIRNLSARELTIFNNELNNYSKINYTHQKTIKMYAYFTNIIIQSAQQSFLSTHELNHKKSKLNANQFEP